NTSGSTGKPKLIQLKKEFMINSAKATGKFFELNYGTTALLCLPTDFIAGKMMLVRAMVLGWSLDIVEPNSNPLSTIKKEYDFSAMVPLQVFNSIDNIFKIKTLIVGGGVVSNELQLKIVDLPTKIYATYGMTETITHIAIKPINIASGYSSKNDVYRTLPNINISKDNRDCLVIDAPKISNKILRTNDIIDLISINSFKWLGRLDHIINSGGIKMIPEQIEKKLSQVIYQRFFITSILDKLLGEKLVLVIEGASFSFDKKTLKNILTKFEIPKEIYFVDSFVVTKTGKIDRSSTKKMITK
ncbi:MAG: AMP-binding protein, partial [Flavobacteriaceae bacterium]|nr:AMP-binding protein [Flavobacteriaceae bacterium]